MADRPGPRPLIAVTGMRSRSVTGLRRSGVVAAERVLDAVHWAGGEPVVIAPLDRDGIPDLGPFAGLVVPGGADLDPSSYGGTLVDHLPPSDVPHRDAFHEVELEPGCAVAVAVGTTTPSVSSYHHQGLASLGTDLRITGRAADGCPEAVAHDTSSVLAVQWHPEDDADTQTAEQRLFNAVVAQARHRALSIC